MFAACGSEPQPTARPTPAPTSPVYAGELAGAAAPGASVLLVTLDTTRADRLGCYGYSAAHTPNLDRLAAQGLLFDEAVAAVPMTLPSHATLLTGLLPPEHGVRTNGAFRLGAEHTTLAERLAAAGYRTAAFVSSFTLDPRFGLAQGFDLYDARFEAAAGAAFRVEVERPAAAVTDASVTWLEQQTDERPFLLWVHYFDPHHPWTAPSPWSSRLSDPYDAEIAYVDDQLARLLAAAAGVRTARDLLIVVAGDHGESLGEHGERFHSRTLYRGAVRVPLIFAGGPITRSARVADVASLADVAPTVLRVLGIDHDLEGRNLLTPAPAEHAVYLETVATFLDHGWAPLFGLRTRSAKVILAPQPEYYDLVEDPHELANRFSDEPAATALIWRLEALLDVWPPVTELGDAATHLDTDVRMRLEALGYLAGTGGSIEGPLPDPKEMLPLFDALIEGRERLSAGDPQAALTAARHMLESHPDDHQALHLAGEALAVLGRLAEAERALERAWTIRPTPEIAALTAQVAMAQGRLGEAEAMLAAGFEMAPDHGAVHIARGDLALVQGDLPAARRAYRTALEVDPYRSPGIVRQRLALVEQAGRRSR